MVIETKMKIYLFILMVVLFSCGGHTKIKYHEVTKQELHNICGSDLGCASIKNLYYEIDCDVYMLPEDQYISMDCYNAVHEHELKHCYKFHWHPPGPTPDIVSVCLTSQPIYTFEIGK